jgi:BlaI family transcriptional regulator, penicillinase repressor
MVDRPSEPPILTRAESEIMSVLWSRGAGTVHDVVAAMSRDSAYTSVLTMLRILEKKGYVTREPEPGGGRAHVYRPRVAATRARRLHVRDLIDRLFGGRSEELMVGLVEDDALSRGELEQLRGLIESRLGGDAGAAPGAASAQAAAPGRPGGEPAQPAGARSVKAPAPPTQASARAAGVRGKKAKPAKGKKHVR